MEKLTEIQFYGLLEAHKILEKDKYGAKVLLTNDDKIIKVFRLKRKFSTALYSPYAQRFKNNAEKLTKLGFNTVKVERIARCPALNKYLVIYPLIQGHTLREILQQDYSVKLIRHFAEFMAKLHEQGVYFRSLHLGNVLQTEDQQLALIDIADLRVYRKKLSIDLRIRNFAHLFRYRQDKHYILDYGWENFCECYLEQANMPKLTMEKLIQVID